jgi:hypothetical protein
MSDSDFSDFDDDDDVDDKVNWRAAGEDFGELSEEEDALLEHAMITGKCA